MSTGPSAKDRSMSTTRSASVAPPLGRKYYHFCPCLNVRVYDNANGHDDAGWIKDGLIYRQYPQLASYHPLRPSSPTTSRSPSLSRKSPARSVSAGKGKEKAEPDQNGTAGDLLSCLVCEVDVLEVLESEEGRKKVKVLVERSDSLLNPLLSPLYDLLLPIPAIPSTFGLPPNSTPPSHSPSHSPAPAPAPTTYLTPGPDPFFLPAPFTPSHPLFHGMTLSSLQILASHRDTTEAAIQRFIEEKRKEVIAFEERIRSEVEIVWAAYERAGLGATPTETPRKTSVTLESGFPTPNPEGSSGSDTPFRETSFSNQPAPVASSPSSQATIVAFHTSFGTTPGMNSLLSASMSANSFFPQSLTQPIASPASKNASDNPLAMAYKRRSDVALDIASSLRVSHMENFRPIVGDKGNDPTKQELYPTPLEEAEEEDEAKDQFEENIVRTADRNREERGSQRTPRDRTIKPLSSPSPGMGSVPLPKGGSISPGAANGGSSSFVRTPVKRHDDESGKKHVKFDAPVEERERAKEKGKEMEKLKEMQDESDAAVEVDEVDAHDAVFDFEDHDIPLDDQHSPLSPIPSSSNLLTVINETSESSMSPSRAPESVQNNKNLVESKMMELVGADLPSHRAAWRGLVTPSKENSSRRRSKGKAVDEEDDDEEEESTKTSLYAASVPIRIAYSMGSRAIGKSGRLGTNVFREPGEGLDLELKTSLRDKPAMYVPPLNTAMRRGFQAEQQGTLHSPDSNPSEHVSRTTTEPPVDIQETSVPRLAQRRTSVGVAGKGRSPSVTRERSVSQPGQDPGPALDDLVSDSDSEKDGEAGKKSFVPPHVRIAAERRESEAEGEEHVGWRSMVKE